MIETIVESVPLLKHLVDQWVNVRYFLWASGHVGRCEARIPYHRDFLIFSCEMYSSPHLVLICHADWCLSSTSNDTIVLLFAVFRILQASYTLF